VENAQGPAGHPPQLVHALDAHHGFLSSAGRSDRMEVPWRQIGKGGMQS
jgi:hypothetical protein